MEFEEGDVIVFDGNIVSENNIGNQYDFNIKNLQYFRLGKEFTIVKNFSHDYLLYSKICDELEVGHKGFNKKGHGHYWLSKQDIIKSDVRLINPNVDLEEFM